jgi:hypothetical protein
MFWLEEGTHCFLLSGGGSCASWRIFYCSEGTHLGVPYI